MKFYTGDLEADGFLDTATRVWCGVFKNHDTGEVRTFSPLDGDNYIRDMLEFLSDIDTLAIHNGIGYDFPLLRKLYGYEFTGRKVDTLLRSRMQRPNRKVPLQCPNKFAAHSVEAWGYRLGLPKREHDEWDRFSPEMLERCKQDVEIQHRIYDALEAEAKNENWDRAHALTAKLFENLQRQEEYGWFFDRDLANRHLATLERWVARIDRATLPSLPLIVEKLEARKAGEVGYVKKPFNKDGTLNHNIREYAELHHLDIAGPFSRISFRRLDLDSSKEVKSFLLAQGWEPDEWNVGGDGKRTSPKLSKSDSFVGVRGSLGRLIARRTQCRQRHSIITGWLTNLRSDDRLPSVVSGLTLTGRAKHHIIANVPRPTSFFGKQMRELFSSKPGWVLVGVDSDANHARQLAARMGDPEYTFAVTSGKKEDGTDLHSVNKRALGLKNISRDQAKIFFYSFLLGAQKFTLAKGLGCTPDEAEKAREDFLRNIPSLGQVIQQLTKEWRKTARVVANRWGRPEFKFGSFIGLDGRRVFCEEEKAILGYALQSDESIQMAAAYNIFHKWMDRRGFKWGEDYGTVCWYHDEFDFECRPEIAEEAGQLAAEAIVWAGRYYGISCPHKGNYKIGKNWKEIH